MSGGKPQRRPLRVSQDSALEFYGRSTVDLAHKLAAQESTQSPLDVEGRESCRILHEVLPCWPVGWSSRSLQRVEPGRAGCSARIMQSDTLLLSIDCTS